jgi:ubiquinone/menaquinone biosynthesis C-methylase UbiE
MDFYKVIESKIKYSEIPKDASLYTRTMDKKYSKFAKYYDFVMTPYWRIWLKKVIPFIEGSKVLEVSFGTGYLMTQYADRFDTYGIDFNSEMIQITKSKLEKKGLSAAISKGNVESLPFENNAFDTVVNTMAFTGYPDGEKALDEMKRVLKKNGKLLLMDFDYPADRNIIGYSLVKIGEMYGDIMKDIKGYLENSGLQYRETCVGGFGSVYLFICEKV